MFLLPCWHTACLFHLCTSLLTNISVHVATLWLVNLLHTDIDSGLTLHFCVTKKHGELELCDTPYLHAVSSTPPHDTPQNSQGRQHIAGNQGVGLSFLEGTILILPSPPALRVASLIMKVFYSLASWSHPLSTNSTDFRNQMKENQLLSFLLCHILQQRQETQNVLQSWTQPKWGK